MYKFAAFILTHGRPDNCKTVKTLRKSGYTGDIYLILDDQDKTIDKYKKNFPECKMVVFNKQEIAAITDTADNSGNLKSVVFARNACHEIAKKHGIDFFIELDDDYSTFYYLSDKDNIWRKSKVTNFDSLVRPFVQFLDSTSAKCICFIQEGDLLGGIKTTNNIAQKVRLLRKAMNTFICKTDRPFTFKGLLNDDVNTYVSGAAFGELFFSSTLVSVAQAQTQASPGGLTDIYLELGTYTKSFTTVMLAPSAVVVAEMGTTRRRLHHKVKTDLAYPKILRESLKKEIL